MTALEAKRLYEEMWINIGSIVKEYEQKIQGEMTKEKEENNNAQTIVISTS